PLPVAIDHEGRKFEILSRRCGSERNDPGGGRRNQTESHDHYRDQDFAQAMPQRSLPRLRGTDREGALVGHQAPPPRASRRPPPPAGGGSGRPPLPSRPPPPCSPLPDRPHPPARTSAPSS